MRKISDTVYFNNLLNSHFLYICRSAVVLPGVKKAVAVTSRCMKRRVKEEPASEEPLGDNPVIVNDVVDDDDTSRMKKPKVSVMKEISVDIETLTLKPVVKQERRVQKARQGKKFMPGSSSRMVNIPD